MEFTISNIIYAFILFVILTPGFLVNIPSSDDKDGYPPFINFISHKITLSSTFVHAIVFCLLFFGLSRYIDKYSAKILNLFTK